MLYKDLREAAKVFHPALLFRETMPVGKIRASARVLLIFAFTFLAIVLAGRLIGLIDLSQTFQPPDPEKNSLFNIEGLLPTPVVPTGGPAAASLSESVSGGIAMFAGDTVLGLALIFFALAIPMTLLLAFYYSYYFRGFYCHEYGMEYACEELPIDFETSEVLFHTPLADITGGFFNSHFGGSIIARCGISSERAGAFLAGRTKLLNETDFSLANVSFVDLARYAKNLFALDKEFAKFLLAEEVQEEEFVGAAEWVSRAETARKRKERWWGKDQLGRLPSLGRDWAYGEIYLLTRYGHDIEADPVYSVVSLNPTRQKELVDELETILIRARGANALLVGDGGASPMEVVARLAKRIYDGKVFPSLEHSRLIVLDTEAVISGKKTKPDFENEFRLIMNQAIKAGNIILVFPNLPVFIASAQALGSDAMSLMALYLASPAVHIVATADSDRFHQTIEPSREFLAHFEAIIIKEVEHVTLMRILQDAALWLEGRDGVFFTYPSLTAIAESADRYFPTGVMPDKALDLISEVSAQEKQKGDPYISRTKVYALVEGKTGIPLGKPQEEEREKLLNLEKILHQRIVGQEKAVSAVSDALRRVRLGLQNPNRPLASFLFLGPTGVGKTETSKALAHAFFGSEAEIIRVDMSEFRTDDALDRLIGSFESGKAGILASRLREKPYGVLLLDEFEKASREVNELFLQVLDEGFFSDMRGKKVSARNLIIVATSNAGSDMIWEWSKGGIDVSEKTKEIVDAIVQRGIFKPELLNRFDGVITFHPLSEDQIKTIAVLMLDKLKDRLEKKGLEFVINDAAVNALMRTGYDPQFGARPMQRAVSDTIEQVVAQKMLRGEVAAGSKVELTESELS